MAKQTGYLTWNTCTEAQKDIIEERLGSRIAYKISITKGGSFPLFWSIRYNAFSSLYGRAYIPGKGFIERNMMSIEQVNYLIFQLFPDIDFGNVEFQLEEF